MVRPLTTGIDDITTVGSNSTVKGSVSATAVNNTFQGFDTIKGTGDGNTLEVTVLDYGTGDLLAAPQVSGFQTINIRAVDVTPADIIVADASNFVGSTAINSNLSTSAVTFNGLETQTVGKVGGSGALIANYDNDVTSATIAISQGATAGAITTSGTLLAANTITSSGAKNTIGALELGAAVTTLTIDAQTALTTGPVTNDDAAALETITVSGAGAVNLSATALESAVTTIDASENTGGLTATLGTGVKAFTGGEGDDVITTAATTASGAVIDGGTGNNILALAATNDVSTVAKASQYQNFETLRLQKAAQGDLSVFGDGVKALQVAALTDGNFTGLTATQAQNITVRGDQTTSLTLGLKDSSGKADVVRLNLTNPATTSTNVDVTGLSIVGVETLQINATTGVSTDASAVTFGATGANALTAVEITGSANTSLTATNTDKAMTVDATASTGNFVTTGNYVKGSTISGSLTGKNTFTVGGADGDNGSTYIGGGAADSFLATVSQLTATGSGDTVLQGGGGTDKLTITGGSTAVTDLIFTNVSGVEQLVFDGTGAVSATGLGSAFSAAFATGVTVTSGNIASENSYTFSSGLYKNNVNLTVTTATLGEDDDGSINITTGSGADTIVVNAAEYVGEATGAVAAYTITTGDGNDTITFSYDTLLAVGTPTINAGKGADTIFSTGVNGADITSFAKYVIAAGDSTTSAYDVIHGFKAGDGNNVSSGLDFAVVDVNDYATTTNTGIDNLSVTVAATGLVTFGGTAAASASLADKISAVQTVVTETNGDTVLFTQGADSYVFNNNTSGDSLVELVGVTATSLIETNATTAGAIFVL